MVGAMTSAAFGHTLGRAVAMGYVTREEGVDAAYLEQARFEIEIAGDRDRGAGEPAAARTTPRAAHQELGTERSTP